MHRRDLITSGAALAAFAATKALAAPILAADNNGLTAATATRRKVAGQAAGLASLAGKSIATVRRTA